jgi:hypothetical protein
MAIPWTSSRKSADCRGNEGGDAREAVGDDCSEGEPVGGGDTSFKAAARPRKVG